VSPRIAIAIVIRFFRPLEQAARIARMNFAFNPHAASKHFTGRCRACEGLAVKANFPCAIIDLQPCLSSPSTTCPTTRATNYVAGHSDAAIAIRIENIRVETH
jgi:hypothetical protein